MNTIAEACLTRSIYLLYRDTGEDSLQLQPCCVAIPEDFPCHNSLLLLVSSGEAGSYISGIDLAYRWVLLACS